MRSSFLPYVKIELNYGISRQALNDTKSFSSVISVRLLQENTNTEKK